MINTSLIRKYTPLDKSWIIRMGVLDILNGYDNIIKFLDAQKKLGDDLIVLLGISKSWRFDNKVYVGESGAIYRFLQFASWKLRLGKAFILEGTLKKRTIVDNPKIVEWPISKLLTLDNHTSQWASASVIVGNTEIIKNPPYKLAVTYDAVSHWKKRKNESKSWSPVYDKTISRQAKTFTQLLMGKSVNFIPQHSEDYCFARAFGFITKEEGVDRWPSLMGHESNRIEEMENSLYEADNDRANSSKDHRVIQAIAMRGKVNGNNVKIKNPYSVSKSWPQFWNFLNSY